MTHPHDRRRGRGLKPEVFACMPAQFGGSTLRLVQQPIDAEHSERDADESGDGDYE